MQSANRCFVILLILCFNYPINALPNSHSSNGPNFVSVMTPCTKNSDCAIFGIQNVTCSEQYCECNGTKFCIHPNEVRVNKLEESCKTDGECIIENSVCEKGKCRCKEGRVPSSDKRDCLLDMPQKNCTNCTKLVNTCTEGQCFCGDGFVRNNASTQCLEVAKTISGPCQEDVQCSETFVNAVCINEICQCQPSSRFNNTSQTCVKNAILGDECERDEDCMSATGFTTKLGCISGQCKCKSGFVEKAGQCTSLIEPCIEPLCSGFIVEMQLNQPCVPGRCECPEERQFCTNGDSTGSNTKGQRGRPEENPENYKNLYEEMMHLLYNQQISSDIDFDYRATLIVILIFLFLMINAVGAQIVYRRIRNNTPYTLYMYSVFTGMMLMMIRAIIAWSFGRGPITYLILAMILDAIILGCIFLYVFVLTPWMEPERPNRREPERPNRREPEMPNRRERGDILDLSDQEISIDEELTEAAKVRRRRPVH